MEATQTLEGLKEYLKGRVATSTWNTTYNAGDFGLFGPELRLEAVRWIFSMDVVGEGWREILKGLLRTKLPFSDNDLVAMARWLAGQKVFNTYFVPIDPILKALESRAERTLSPELTAALTELRDRFDRAYGGKDGERGMSRVVKMLECAQMELVPGSGPTGKGRTWRALLNHCRDCTSSKPSAKWNHAAQQHIREIDAEDAGAVIAGWFQETTGGEAREWKFTEHEGTAPSAPFEICLKGLVWTAALLRTDTICRSLGHLCVVALKKEPGLGPRMPSLANATLYALGQLVDGPSGEAALGQMARLKTRMNSRSALKLLESALESAAQRRGMSRDELEEIGVPAYGFEAGGVMEQTFDGARVVLRIHGPDVTTTWTNDKGKEVKSPPASMKAAHGEALKELKAAAVDAERMISAQSARLDNLMGLTKTWAWKDFEGRYLAHALVGTLARRLIWTIDETPVLFRGDLAEDVQGGPVTVGTAAKIRLWHPVGRSTEEIVAWRRRIEGLQITQPFKQAYRELYLLTVAERNTGRYSNRYAAHIIRQHQFNALCIARGWKNKLRLMVDDSYSPPTRELPNWGLRAEFWVEGAGDQYGTDTNEAGVYLRLATDQVRFYRMEAAANYAHASGGGYTTNAEGPGARNINEPLPLDEIPALVFSEVMRDVDLFVGVASVGNDPTWQDGGPAGRYQTYWQNFSFGELNETAKTRKAVLEGLVPRLKIAGQCSLVEKFLQVQGKLRAYKIHLGSGNILMEPNDQYLCIVASQAGREGTGLYLPFEGDSTLAVILSKAFLLAADDKIKDETITRQIASR